jgi:uncharacterized protein (TIGR03435 family)
MARTAVALGVLICAPILSAQQPLPADPSLAFEVVSVKPNTSGGNEDSDVQPNGRVVITNMSLANLVRGVFEAQRHELVVGDRVPSWFASERWDITAVGPPVTDEASQRRVRIMMQNMLADRFKLVTKRELRDTPVYALVVGRSDGRPGPQMRPSSADCVALLAAFKASGATRQTPDSKVCGGKSGTGRIWGTGVLLDDFIRRLIPAAGRPVLDMTGLTGPFDLDLKWTPDDASAPATGAALVTAIQEQLGLRLEPRRAPINVFVIDSVERPTPN